MTEQVEQVTAESIMVDRFCQEAPLSVANRLETLSVEDAVDILSHVPNEHAMPVWSALSPFMASEMLDLLRESDALAVLEAIDPGRAASLLANLDSENRASLLDGLKPSLSHEIKDLLMHPIDTAGGLMDTRVLLFKGDLTVAEALQMLRSRMRNQTVYELRIVDDAQRLQSIVQLNTLALADADQTLDALSERVKVVVEPSATREEISEKMEDHGLEELTVVDHEGRILGVIRHSTLIDVLKEDVSVDIQTMVGVSKDERATSSSRVAVRKRLPWMQVNLVTVFAAAAVVGIFESTIAKITALAVLLPVVAGQAGNAGAQALAVTMRGLALREIRVQDWPKLIRKEALVGLSNGIAVAVVCGIGVYIWSGQPGLVLVISSSMLIAMVIAGLAGVLVPVGLQKIGQDPAVASSIVLSTVTDIAGLFAFLGIATLFAGLLI